jgi:hypothetical protein
MESSNHPESNNQPMIQDQKRGVYFLANDRILDITIAFLNSFRSFNPDIPLCLIPFRNDFEELAKLSELYMFSIYDDRAIIGIADQISLLFHADITGHYRKLACWHGPFDQFIYIDVDMLVLKNIDFAFRFLKDYGFITSLSNIPEAVQWVWKPSISATSALTKDQIAFGANTGFIVSERNHIPLENLGDRAGKAASLAPHMELYCKEQPLLNYLMVTSGLPYTSLWASIDKPSYPEGYVEYWAGYGKKKWLKGIKTLHLDKPREIFLVHWAGVWQPSRQEIKLFGILTMFRLKRKIWTISLKMPLKKLWKKYRYMKYPQFEYGNSGKKKQHNQG